MYGAYIDRNNPSLKEKLPEIRRLVLSGDIFHAEELILQYMAATPGCMRHYTLLGELDIALNRHLPFAIGWLPDSTGAENYSSDLDLMTGVLNINHTQGRYPIPSRNVYQSPGAGTVHDALRAKRRGRSIWT